MSEIDALVKQLLTDSDPIALALEVSAEEIIALAQRIETLTRERDEALTHVGSMPTPERIATAHSRLPSDWFKSGRSALANNKAGHASYYQGRGEACYICTLIALWERAEGRRDRLAEALREIEQRHADLLELARRVSSSFIATQDRFGKERRRLLWQLRDAVEAAPSLSGTTTPDESGLPVTAAEQLNADDGIAIESSYDSSQSAHVTDRRDALHGSEIEQAASNDGEKEAG